MMKKGFNLAEVLITLGIIGVVFAMTIPTLMNNNNETEKRTGAKAAYSLLSQAMATITMEHGGSIKGLCSDFDNLCFKDLFKPAFSYVKDCDHQILTNKCWAAHNWMDGSEYGSWLDGAGSDNPSAIVLKNGMLILFRLHYGDCDWPSNNSCGWISVDINGFKKPNQWGKDVFYFHVQDGVIKPCGIDGDTGNGLTCDGTETGSGAGAGCTAKYLME